MTAFVAVLSLLLFSVAAQDAAPSAQLGSVVADRNGDGITELPLVNYTVACDTGNYYAALLSNVGNPGMWEKGDLTNLLQNTHRNAVPRRDQRDENSGVTSNPLYEALIDLDHANAVNMVRLIYGDRPMAARPYVDIDAWTIEHLWPTQRGAIGEVVYSDVHNLRPERTRVTFRRSNLFYGRCGTVEFADVCEVPAAQNTADDTATDEKIWLPPADVRGDIARAMFYMDTRYSADPDEVANAVPAQFTIDGDKLLNLDLVDCAPFEDNQMGYKSQLLQWHLDDPVNDIERNRNNDACSKYQGNRNPFVDYPELVAQLFGFPEEIQATTRTYPSCVDIPTPMPTPTPNTCSMIQPGNIVFYVVEMDDPDGIGFLALVDVPGDVDLYITDNAWTGSNFLANEGVLRLSVPSRGYAAGERFGFGPKYGYNQTWEPYEGLFSLGVNGDTVMLYCLNSDESPKPLLAFSNNGLRGEGGWSPPGLSPQEYGFERSALPDTLVNASLAVPHYDNYYYDELEEAFVDELRASMFNPDHWVGQDVTMDGMSGAPTTSLWQMVTITTTIIVGLWFSAI